ncbi:unnamed protein product [Symbiodinium sp. CCMP2592]|nr:unnamed protein product [Symbiodinium sp. CCMP2592]
MAGNSSPPAKPEKRARRDLEAAAKAAAAPPQGGRGTIRALSVQELTRAFLAHDDEIQSILHQLSVVHKLPVEGPLATTALDAIQGWLKDHKPGQPHPSGSPTVAVAAAVLPFLKDSTKPESVTQPAWEDFKAALALILDDPDKNNAINHELALFSARANAKKMHSTLLAHVSTYSKLIEDFEGEALGKRPQGTLARKARGLPTTS